MNRTWKDYSEEKGIDINDQYFLVYCETVNEMEEFARILNKDYGIHRIDVNPGSIPRGPWLYVNLNTGLMFHGNIGVNVLGGPVIGGHALKMHEFLGILNTYSKYDGLGILEFGGTAEERGYRSMKPKPKSKQEIEDYNRRIEEVFKKHGLMPKTVYGKGYKALFIREDLPKDVCNNNQQSMTLQSYKKAVRNCLDKALKTAYGTEKNDYVSSKMKEYENEFPEFLEKNLSPEAAATAILMNY